MAVLEDLIQGPRRHRLVTLLHLIDRRSCYRNAADKRNRLMDKRPDQTCVAGLTFGHRRGKCSFATQLRSLLAVYAIGAAIRPPMAQRLHGSLDGRAVEQSLDRARVKGADHRSPPANLGKQAVRAINPS